MQKDDLIMCALQEHIIWSARQWAIGKKVVNRLSMALEPLQPGAKLASQPKESNYS